MAQNITSTGGLTIAAGTLMIGDGNQSSGSVAGDIVDNATLAFNRPDTFIMAGNVSGTGGISQVGSGTTILTGNNSVTGTSQVSRGVLQIGNGGTTGSIAGNIVDNAALVFKRSDTITYAGNIYGTGTLTQAGTGTLILNGKSDTGTTTIASGTVMVGNGGTTGAIIGNIIDNGTLAFNRSNYYVHSSNISGTGGISQIGSGKTILEGNVTVSGPVVVSNGELQVGDGAVAGAITSNIVDNATLTFRRSDDATYAGAISGSGRVIQAGTGTVILSGANTYTGGSVIASGTLMIGANGTSGSIVGDVLDNGTLAFNRTDTYTFAGNISGTGGIWQIGSGTTILTGIETFTGPVVVTNGILVMGNTIIPGANGVAVIGDGTNLAATDINFSGTFAFNRSDTYVYGGNLSGTGKVQVIGTGTTVFTGMNSYTGGTTITGGTFQLGNGGTTGSIAGDIVDNAALVFKRSNAVTFSGLISGTGTVTQAGTGTLTLNNANTYTGLTSVSAGTLIVGDASHPGAKITGGVNVGAGGTLGGHGTILGAVTNSGGTVMPGGSIGTLTVNSYTQGPSGTLEIEVSPLASSQLHVNAAAALDGHLKLDFDPGVAGTRAYQFLTASAVTGQFADLSANGLSDSEAFGIQYSSTAATLVLTPKAPAQLYADFQTASFETADRFADQIYAHWMERNCSPIHTASGQSGVPTCPELSVWWQTSAGAGSQDGDATALGFNARWISATGGIDVQTDSGLSLGVAATYARSKLGLAASSDHITTDSFGISVLAGIPLFEGQLDASGIWVSNDGQAHRTVTPSGSPDMTSRSTPKNNVFGASAQYAHTLLWDDLTGFARLRYLTLDQDALSETGAAPFDFAVASDTKSNLSADLGVRLSHIWHLRSGALLVPEATLGVSALAHQSDTAIHATLSDATGSFATSGPSRSDTALIAGIGVTATKLDGFALFIRADGRASGSEREGSMRVGGRLVF